MISYDYDDYCDGPQEDDYTVCDGRGGGYAVSCEGKYLGEYDDFDAAQQFIRQNMKDEQYFPNVWFISDHGNAHLILS